MLPYGSDLHKHCLNCYRRDCTDYYVNYCPMEICANNCGAQFHACKREEHNLVCPKKVVSCTNSYYGCPILLPRKDILKHLEFCPASTIVCTMEWSRNVSEEKDVELVNHFDPHCLKEHDMDTATALNDQCIALNWIRKMKELGHSCADHNEETESPYMSPVNYKDYQLMLYMQTEKATQFAVDDYSGYPYFDSNVEENKESYVEDTPKGNDEATSPCASAQLEQPVDSELSCCRTLQMHTYRAKFCHRVHGHAIKAEMYLQPSGVTLCHRYHENDYAQLACKRVIEFLPRYDTKHSGMYTFMCNSLLRRDEYCAHYQNFHCDFHSSLNGWLEERCPYHIYGCQYSRMRFASKPGGKFVFDHIRNCLAVRIDHSVLKPLSETESTNLLNLPWEILQRIFSYLDSYSIGQMASTCSYLRSICMSMIRDRGIVEMQWENCKGENGFQWKPTGFRWLFSDKCTSLSCLSLNKSPFLAGHIVNCQYAKSVIDSKKYSSTRQYVFGAANSRSQNS